MMYAFEKDTKCGYLTFKAHDQIQVNLIGLHNNGSQWQRPTEFLPDRFDPTHPLSRTPSGEKRHSHAFLPFGTGQRACFG